jgi:hypothetical protein
VFCCFNKIPQYTFSFLCFLRVEGCNFNSSSIPFIPCLKVLKIYVCENLTDLEILGDDLEGPKKSFSTDVEISSCRALKLISICREVSQLKVTCCPQLHDITMNRPIGSLQANHCPKLNISQSDLRQRNYE